jgi:hypothetical protein
MPNIINPEQASFPAWQARRLSPRLVAYLREPGREAAASRVRAELQILNDREGALHLFEQQLYAAEVHLSSLYSDEAAAKAPVGRKPDAVQIQRIEQQIVEAKDEISRLRPRRSAFSTLALETRYNACTKLIVGALSGGAPLRFLKPAPAARGTTLEGTREKIAQLQADLRTVADAPLPASWAKDRVKKFIEELAAPINVRPAVEAGEAPYLPLIHVTSQVAIPHALGVLVWVMKDRIIELVNREIDEIADDKHALTFEQRAKRTAEIKRDILAAERLEAQIEGEAMQAGEVPELRHDANPRAILNVEAA